MMSFAIRNTVRYTLKRKNATKAFYCNAAAPAAASTITQTDSLTSSKFDLPPAPAPPSNLEMGIVNDAGEVAFSAMQLGGWSSPVAWVQSSFEFLHISCDLPWWATIVTGTVVVRLITMPFLIQQQKYMSQMSKVMPEIQKLQRKISQSRIVGDDFETAQLSTKLVLLMKSNNVKPVKSLMAPLIQAPFFISFFMALRQMTNLPVESMKLGGLFWFTDLTVPDPYYILPLATCSTVLLTVEMSMSQSMAMSANSHLGKYIVRAIPVVMFPFLMRFEAGILCYWLSTNIFSFCQSILFRQPVIRKMLNLGEIAKPIASTSETGAGKSKGFLPDMREAYSNMKLAKRADDRRLADINSFKSAGLGPIIKTYKYDPTKTSSKI